MGINRYSRDHDLRRWQQRFDELQQECHNAWRTPTIGDLLDHGITQAKWRCRSVGWRDDGKEQCWHSSETFSLERFGRNQMITKLRRNYVCSACGRNRPFIELLWSD